MTTTPPTDAIADETPATYSIVRWSEFTTKFAELTKRAARLGVPVPTYEVVETILEHRWVTDDEGSSCWLAAGTTPSQPQRGWRDTGVVRERRTITVSGLAPRLPGGWRLGAVLQACEDLTLVKIVPGLDGEVPGRYRSASAATCEHCRLARDRRESFVVLDAQGEARQVGRQCLRDYLGHATPEAIAAWCEYVVELDFGPTDLDVLAGGGHGDPAAVDRADFLARVATTIRLLGWRSRATAREHGGQATADVVWLSFFPEHERHNARLEARGLCDACEAERLRECTPADVERADRTAAWLADLADRSELNDYLWNLRVAGAAATVTGKTAGILASAISACEREQERAAQRAQERAVAAKSQHVGTVGVRQSFGRCVVVSARELASDWGVRTLLVFRDEAGNRIKWFASGGWTAGAGEVATDLVGRVTRHDTYRDVAETVITRARATWAEAEADEAQTAGAEGAA